MSILCLQNLQIVYNNNFVQNDILSFKKNEKNEKKIITFSFFPQNYDIKLNLQLLVVKYTKYTFTTSQTFVKS